MKRAVVDTNVAVVANGRTTNAAPACRIRCIDLLLKLKEGGVVVLDSRREILREYERILHQAGQPGVGDMFYRHLLQNLANRYRVCTVTLTPHPDRHYVEFPDDHRLATLDPADRKFAAAARLARAPVANAVDSDWHEHAAHLQHHGIIVHFVCGRERFVRRGAGDGEASHLPRAAGRGAVRRP